MTIILMVNFMNLILKRIQKEFNLTPDLIIKELFFNKKQTLYIIFLETICSSNKVNDYVLKPLIATNDKKKINKKNFQNFIAGPNTILIDKIDKIEFYLTNGFTIIILKDKVYAIETKGDLSRSISPNEVQMSINGPKDSFTENYQTNIGLIKRRIKSNTLKIENIFVGRKTNTNVGILYFSDIADDKLVNDVIKRLEKIDIDGIVDSSTISYLIDNENKTLFPTVKYSERPDEVAIELMRGKIVLIVDTSPFALIIPSFFIDFINPSIDNYNKTKNINYIKILRLIAFVIAMITPGFYNALLCFNPESIPRSLLINFSIQREGVPFPLIIETIIMLIVCDILKESDLRFPSNYGTAISILGAIVLGQAAVDAGIASPVIIIIIAITFIASLSFTDIEISNALRYFTFIFLILSGFFGLYGIFLASMYFLIYICSINSFNKPYFAPIAPFNKNYFFNTVFKKSIQKDKSRSSLLTNKNKTKQEENS
ncbi:MAG: spore germination protein [Firmicutes bacterium]|nr:spore germination protein [Bacillota bacterium]